MSRSHCSSGARYIPSQSTDKQSQIWNSEIVGVFCSAKGAMAVDKDAPETQDQFNSTLRGGSSIKIKKWQNMKCAEAFVFELYTNLAHLIALSLLHISYFVVFLLLIWLNVLNCMFSIQDSISTEQRKAINYFHSVHGFIPSISSLRQISRSLKREAMHQAQVPGHYTDISALQDAVQFIAAAHCED